MTSKGGPILASSLEVIKLKLFFFLKEKKSAFVCAKFATKLRHYYKNGFLRHWFYISRWITNLERIHDGIFVNKCKSFTTVLWNPP